jgi:aryl-alcohol dehydrogenase-like predicted oxidoreductase
MDYNTKTLKNNSPSKASKLALGSAQFGSIYGVSNKPAFVSQSETCRILELAFNSGISCIDTARGYLDSESFLGKCGVSRFNIISKIPDIPDSIVDVRKWIHQEFNKTLSELNLSRIDGLLFHNSRNLLSDNSEVIINSVKELRDCGLVRKIGVSVYSPQELSLIYNKFKFDLVQLPLNIFDRRFEDSGWLDTLFREGVEIHARSIFLQGLLLLPKEDIPVKFKKWSNYWDNYHDFLKKNNFNPVDLCLSYPMSLAQIKKIVVGVDSVNQLRDLIKYVNKELVPVNSLELKCDEKLLIDASFWDKI